MSNKQRIRNRKYNDAVKRTNDARKIGFNKSDRLVKGIDITRGIKMINREKIRNNARRTKNPTIHKLDRRWNKLKNKHILWLQYVALIYLMMFFINLRDFRFYGLILPLTVRFKDNTLAYQ